MEQSRYSPGWILLLAVVIAGGIWFVRSGKTKYTSVNDGIGEMTAKANEGVMDKGTGDELKDSLYVPRKIDKTKKLIAFSFSMTVRPERIRTESSRL